MVAGAALDYSKPLLMGILNLTPDSFSDGGRYAAPAQAVSRALAMVEQGADIVDVGGESTRPGSARVDVREQQRRVLDTLAELREGLPTRTVISIDTTSAEVAAAALDAGAAIVNDISAGRDDPEILALAAERRVPIVLMHMQGTPATMQDNPQYTDVVGEVGAFLRERAAAAEAAGLAREHVVLDPGIGFGKTRAHNLTLIAELSELVALGYPTLLGASRKRFMGSLCRIEQYDRLVPATCVTTALGVMAGVNIFRVHDVADNRQAADVAWAIKRSGKD